MLLPVDLRDWVRSDDMVHFVLEAVEGMALGALKVNRRGSGSPQYPPQMMSALLIYCYSQGVMSSRKSVHYDRAESVLTETMGPFSSSGRQQMARHTMVTYHLKLPCGGVTVQSKRCVPGINERPECRPEPLNMTAQVTGC